MRKRGMLLLTLLLAFGLLSGCGTEEETSSAGAGETRTAEETPAPEVTEEETEEETMEEIEEAEEMEETESGSENADSRGEDVAAGAGQNTETTAQGTGDPVVYMTADISSEGLIAVYEALEASPTGNIAVKLSTGEPGSNYLRTDLIGDLVQSFEDPTIVECNTAYGGSRANTAMHYQVAENHGYTAIADVDIMDENGSMTLPVTGGSNLTENYVGANFANYDYYVVLSHFKGHSMAGYGGAIKNISIGIASSEGKSHIHSGGTGGSMWGGDQDAFLESMAEAGKSVVDYLDGNILYINVMNRLSVDCDCDGKKMFRCGSTNIKDKI